MSEDWVLTETEAVELLALLISSARTQMDEPAHYGPMRLLTATERLSAKMLERSSDKSKAFLQDNHRTHSGVAYGDVRCRDVYGRP